MKSNEFINALDNYITYDQPQSVINLIQKATLLDTKIILSILAMVNDDYNKQTTVDPNKFVSRQPFYRSPSKIDRVKVTHRTMGQLIYGELQNTRNRYTFSGNNMRYRIKKFNFKRHFEFI